MLANVAAAVGSSSRRRFVVASGAGGGLLGPSPVFAQTMLRVKDPAASRAFYEGKLGMKYLTFLEFPDLDFSLYFFAYTDVDTPDDSAPQPERATWLWKQRFPTMVRISY